LDLSTQDASCLISVARVLGEALFVLSEKTYELSPAAIQRYSEFIVSGETIVITKMGRTYVPELPPGTIVVTRRR
jgi:hypothetical protein